MKLQDLRLTESEEVRKFGGGMYLSADEPEVGEGYGSNDDDDRIIVSVYISGDPDKGVAELKSIPKVLMAFSEEQEQSLHLKGPSVRMAQIAVKHGVPTDSLLELFDKPGVNYVKVRNGYFICAFGDD